jgi:hypothetical protein
MESPWEDNLLERKVGSDLKDLLKTLVAFANSVQPGHTAVILIGERNDGTIQGVSDPDSIQKKVRKEADEIYPPIIWRSRVYEKAGSQCIRVEIEYSGDTPHFGGPAWVRKGSETIKASDEVFQLLIETRSGMVRELTKWLSQLVTFQIVKPHYIPESARLVFVNSFWITLKRLSDDRMFSFSMSQIRLNFDDSQSRLKIEVHSFVE